MRAWIVTLAALASLASGPASAQGFAGLGLEVEGFAVPAPDPDFDFPADHGAHPEYRVEWWYVTATLEDAEGNAYGIQWTLFRSAMRPETGPGWGDPQLWMGHAALSTATAHYHDERLARGGVGQAGVRTSPFRAWIDEWSMISHAEAGADALSALHLSAAGPGFAYALDLTAEGPLVFHGEGGFSVKAPGGYASYYYSQPFYRVSGAITLEGREIAVTGQGWLDREWSSQPLAPTQDGWDWFSIVFDGGDRLMAFRLRDREGPDFTAATWIGPDGATEALPDGALRLTPLEEADVAGRPVPVRWRLQLPARGLDIETTPLNPQSWMPTLFPYWEGAIAVTGSHAGRGYLEMTGYE
ncbi:MAG: iron ABC transporter permease [Rhodobacteraceae bacterium]|nr:iron ABC transporter permease [Paracoccaceae bacterium]